MRFLHTGDWQLGMTRHYFSDGAQERYSEARFEALRTIGRVAREQRCEFVVVCGDVFETNQVDRKTVSNALEALASIPVPVHLLPGNHDPLDAGSIFRQPTFQRRRPSHVHVFESTAPVTVSNGVELVGAPWTSKRPLHDLVQAACRDLAPSREVLRICVAHGAVDALAPDKDNPALIGLAAAERLLAEQRIHYLALGDKHSLTDVGASGRVRYAGTPEPTDFDEPQPGFALVVELTPDSIQVEPVRLGTWSFAQREFELASDADLDALERALQETPNKQRTVLKLGLVGTLSLRQQARLEERIEVAGDLFAAIVPSESRSYLAVLPDDADFSALQLAGFAERAAARLRELAVAGERTDTARRALGLLLRLAERKS